MHDTRDQWTTLPQEGSAPELRLYLARPDDQVAYPSIIVIHEAFGLDAHIQDVTRRFAAEGFVGVAPDLFWVEPFGRTVTPDEIKQVMALRSTLSPERRGDPAALEEAVNQLPAEQAGRFRQVLEWMGRRDVAALVAPLERVIAWARGRSDTTGTVGAVGFCFGGGMTLRLAFAGAALDAAVPFYGQNPPLDQVGNVRCPLLLIYGRRDPFIMPGVPALLTAIQNADLSYGMHIYEEAGHAFLNDARPDVYHAASAHDAWQHTTHVFRQHLH